MRTSAGRGVAVAAAAVAALVVLAGPADASFSARTVTGSTSITTGTVAPPTNVTAVLSSCSNGRWMSVTVSWTDSASRGVSGYVVDAHRSDGSTTEVASVAASATSASTTVDKLSTGSTTVTFTVITQTSYGWTAESLGTGPLTC